MALGGGLGAGSAETSSRDFARPTEGCLGEPGWLQRRAPLHWGTAGCVCTNKPGSGQGTHWNQWIQPITPPAHAGSCSSPAGCAADSTPAAPRLAHRQQGQHYFPPTCRRPRLLWPPLHLLLPSRPFPRGQESSCPISFEKNVQVMRGPLFCKIHTLLESHSKACWEFC